MSTSAHDPYAPLRYRNYLCFTLGRVLFVLGVQMQTICVSWIIYQELHRDTQQAALALGMIGLAQVSPIVLLSLVGGQAADRYNRKNLALFGQFVIALGAVGVFLTAHFHWPIGCYYGALFFAATGRAFNIPAVNALVTQLLPREVLPAAMAWNSSAFQLSSILGPALGGLVVAQFPGEKACLINVLVLAVGYYFFALTKPLTHFATSRAPTTLHGLLSGVRFVLQTKILLAMLLLDLFATLLGGATALLPIYAHQILHTNAAGFGLLRAMPAVGAITMALWMVHQPGWKRAGLTLTLAVTGYGLATLVFGLSTWFWLSILALFLIGACDNISVVIRQTVDQMLTPSEMRGRVSAFSFIFVSCSNELGEMESGLTASWLGPVGSVIFGGVCALLVVAGSIWLFPELLKLGRLQDLRPEPLAGPKPEPSISPSAKDRVRPSDLISFSPDPDSAAP